MADPSKPKRNRRKSKEQLEEEKAIRMQRMMMDARLTFLWIQDLERQEKITRKAQQLANKRKAGYIT